MSQGSNQIFASLCEGQAVLRLFPIIGLLTAIQLGAVSESACLPQRCRGQRPFVSAGHVKEPDLLCMRPVEHVDRLGGGLQ